MGKCLPVGSGARRSSSVLHQQRRHIFSIENVFPCQQHGLLRKKKTPGQTQWRPNTALCEGLYLRSSSWFHENEERSKGRCSKVELCGGGSRWRQRGGWGGRRSLERHQNTTGIDRIYARLPIAEARTHLRRAPLPRVSRRLQPVPLRLSRNPDQKRSFFCGLRPYRPC